MCETMVEEGWCPHWTRKRSGKGIDPPSSPDALRCSGSSSGGNDGSFGEQSYSRAYVAAKRYLARSASMCDRASCWRMPPTFGRRTHSRYAVSSAEALPEILPRGAGRKAFPVPYREVEDAADAFIRSENLDAEPADQPFMSLLALDTALCQSAGESSPRESRLRSAGRSQMACRTPIEGIGCRSSCGRGAPVLRTPSRITRWRACGIPYFSASMRKSPGARPKPRSSHTKERMSYSTPSCGCERSSTIRENIERPACVEERRPLTFSITKMAGRWARIIRRYSR
ncbi:hypothetical protein D3C86_1386910 [compost metagenome]